MNFIKRSLLTLGTATALSLAAYGLTDHLARPPSQAFAASNPSGLLDANIFVNLAKKVVPSVVNISTFTTVKSPYMQGPSDDLFRRFFEEMLRRGGRGGGGGGAGPEDEEGGGLPPDDGAGGGAGGPRATSLGTGFIIDASGIVLTNNHVVGEADEIKIRFTEAEDEKPSDGEVIGRDPELDLALIKVKTKREMVPLSLGDSDALEVGEYVMAVGQPFGQGHSVTHGIISAKGRISPELPLQKYIQTDAPINPGNSGGPLVNLRGEVIGINNAIDQRAQNIGFAIPINVVKLVLPQLKSKGVVARGYIGVGVKELNPDFAVKLGAAKDLEAPFITQVYPGEPADKAGIKNYDIVLAIAGKHVKNSLDLINAVTGVTVGESVPIKILRGGKEMELKVRVAQRPGSQPTAKPPRADKKRKGHKAAPVDTGMTLEDVTPQIARELGLGDKVSGVVVSATTYGGPADRAGLIRGDVILEVDRKSIKNADDFFDVVKEKKSYLLRVRRADPQGREDFTVILLDLK